MTMKKPLLSWIIAASFILPSMNLLSQTDSKEPVQAFKKRVVFGEYDKAVTFPVMEGIPGQKDAQALRVVSLYLDASANGQWKGFDATGTMTVGSGESQKQIPASLSVGQRNRYRLDITTPSGIRSVRVEGPEGAVQQEDGKTFNLPAASAGTGLIPLPTTLSEAAGDKRDSLIDDGLVELDGAKLHKITFIRPLFSRSLQAQLSPEHPLITTLFFDPKSHLLVKSADAVLLDTTSQTHHLRVITYEDSRAIDGYVVPYRYRETIDGRLSWTLELTNVTVATNHEASYFHF